MSDQIEMLKSSIANVSMLKLSMLLDTAVQQFKFLFVRNAARMAIISIFGNRAICVETSRVQK